MHNNNVKGRLKIEVLYFMISILIFVSTNESFSHMT